MMKRVLCSVLLGGALLVAAPTAAFAHDDGGSSNGNGQHASATHREDRGGRFSREHPGDERSQKEEHSGGSDDPSCPYKACEFDDCTKHVDNCEK